MEPYKKGTPFSHWVERLEFLFVANKISESDRRAYFIAVCGPYIYAKLKLLFPVSNLTDIPLETMIEKLKMRIDRTATDVPNTRETNADVFQLLKLQTKLCTCGLFKDTTFHDRLITGLNEADKVLETAKKITRDWGTANTSSGTLTQKTLPLDEVTKLIKLGEPVETAMASFLAVHNARNQQVCKQHVKLPVKSRLGFQPYDKNHVGQKNVNVFQPTTELAGKRTESQRKKELRICFFCGMAGHVVRCCFKLKNLRRNAIAQMKQKVLDSQTQTETIDYKAMETDSDSDEAGNWKRSNK
ncbi:uncharacterized protein LOC129726026 [Wyeomyia smithii]|uniref:uncharacterized protein LOC129726026 n=1 Tax=Wyeomyia smithii TaxID=174621 RepID=UPI0024681399|nr:uncharacterized protein LOC129726026 [Wyeomyia smithii]XP_055538559.1 uncharacterized protein LOC129726026 [Wyeomyia smithii]XP_055538561.1 uncharacterized protein LOC129726026 [Wyeomyia smithii]